MLRWDGRRSIKRRILQQNRIREIGIVPSFVENVCRCMAFFGEMM